MHFTENKVGLFCFDKTRQKVYVRVKEAHNFSSSFTQLIKNLAVMISISYMFEIVWNVSNNILVRPQVISLWDGTTK